MDVDKIIAFEQGELSEQEEAKFLQKINNDDSAWDQQGTYGRHAGPTSTEIPIVLASSIKILKPLLSIRLYFLLRIPI